MCSSLHYSSKSSKHLLTNTFISLLVLVLLLFIPSQPPHFVKETIFTTFWELIYLFVVGTAVCYGLFSRRNGKVENVSYSSSDFSASYGSRISYVSSFFENEVGNTYGYDEKNVTQNCGFGVKFDFDKFNDSRSSRLRNGVGNFDGVCEKNVGKDWNSKCSVGESVVFVTNGNYEVRRGTKIGCYRPLNLPVRSLKSRIVGSGSTHEDTISEGFDKINKVKFGGLVPINLDEKFRETVITSPVPWGSRNERMDLRGNVSNVKPTFVGEAKLPRAKLPTAKHLSPEVLTSEMEEFERNESLRVSFPPASKSSLAPLKSKPSSSKSSSRRFSTVVASEKNTEDNLKGFSKGETEDLLNRETKGVALLNLDVKPIILVKARSISGSISEMTQKNNSEIDFKGLCKGPKENLVCKPESSTSDVRHARLVVGQLKIGLTSEMTCKISSDNNLKGPDKGVKGDLLEKENTSDDFWNLDLNTTNLVNGRCSTTSFSDINGEKKSETISMDFGNHKKEDLLRRKKDGSIDSLKPGVKAETKVKGLTGKKSVRTIRSNEIVEVKRSEEVYLSHISDKLIKHCGKDEAGLLKKSAWEDGLKSEADEHSGKNSDKPFDKKNSKLTKYRNGERQMNGTCALVNSESISMDFENSQVTAEEEEHRTCIVGDTQIESNEVDKKAAEFIAKFREQIRLQKVALERESEFS